MSDTSTDFAPDISSSAPNPNLVARILRRLRSLIQEDQVTMRLPTQVPASAVRLADDYQLRSATPQDHEAWVALLNSDAGFGRWDEARLERDIVSQLLMPGSASLLFHRNRLVGCAAMCRGEFRGQPMPVGMFLILDPEYRGQFKLSDALYRSTMAYAGQAGHREIYVTTFPDRVSALTLYLVNGGQAVHSNLWSVVQWRRIHRRLGPVVARLTRRR